MSNGTNSAMLEREVEAQRHRVESTIDEIKDKLSPGQLVDEILRYSKDGGKQFASNLGQTVSANPLPSALLGVSLAWLIFGSKQNGSAQRKYDGYDTTYDSYATVGEAGLQRVSHAQDELGDWYSEFIDDSGRKYRARANAAGERAGHFVDETGKRIAGFIDEAGARVESFRDEAGNILDQALGWAAHSWNDAAAGISESMRGASEGAAHAAEDLRRQAERLAGTAMHAFENQPLVAGALAFAAGAAIGAALPSTRQEDELVGEYADDVKREASRIAGDMYDKGKRQAAHLYEDASEKAGEVYSDVKRKLGGGEADEPSQLPH